MSKKEESGVRTITPKDNPEFCLDFVIGDYSEIPYSRGSHIGKINKIIDLVIDLKSNNLLNKKQMLCFYEILEEELEKEGRL